MPKSEAHEYLVHYSCDDDKNKPKVWLSYYKAEVVGNVEGS